MCLGWVWGVYGMPAARTETLFFPWRLMQSHPTTHSLCEDVPSKGGEFVREKTDMLAEGAGRRSVARGQAAAGTAAAL